MVYIDGRSARMASRQGALTGTTAGQATRYLQANLVILPETAAEEFLLFCRANPKPCPVLAVSTPGSASLDAIAADLDLRTDLPAYRIWRDGVCVETCADIRAYWRSDLVSFIIGCSFSFEEALTDAGLRIRHIDQGRNVPMYLTNIPCRPVGRFHGPLVVSMRPFTPAAAIQATVITHRFPQVHGAPVHIARPDLIGIHDLNAPDFGDAVTIYEDEIPVFWACGVTPQAALANAGLPFAITHAPGAMLITDKLNDDYADSARPPPYE